MLSTDVQNTSRPLTELPVTRTLASLCKAASDPLRLDIIRVLRRDSFGVQELATIFSMPQPGMSHHLKILSQCGVLETRRQGNSIFYRRALLKPGDALATFQLSLYAAIDEIALSEEYARRVTLVHKERSSQSREFFEKNADKFQERQGMLCELDQYVANVRELLDLTKLPKKSRVLEVGPGQGFLLQELAKRFTELVAIDNSKELLELAKKGLTKSRSEIEFVNGSLENYSPTKPFNAVVMNMVMHHMSSPARVFQKLGQIVRLGGYVLIADLCSHDQEWVKKACGDVWLGLDSGDLDDWAQSAGFTPAQSLFLGLKNGFQIQLKLFRKGNEE